MGCFFCLVYLVSIPLFQRIGGATLTKSRVLPSCDTLSDFDGFASMHNRAESIMCDLGTYIGTAETVFGTLSRVTSAALNRDYGVDITEETAKRAVDSVKGALEVIHFFTHSTVYSFLDHRVVGSETETFVRLNRKYGECRRTAEQNTSSHNYELPASDTGGDTDFQKAKWMRSLWTKTLTDINKTHEKLNALRSDLVACYSKLKLSRITLFTAYQNYATVVEKEFAATMKKLKIQLPLQHNGVNTSVMPVIEKLIDELEAEEQRARQVADAVQLRLHQDMGRKAWLCAVANEAIRCSATLTSLRLRINDARNAFGRLDKVHDEVKQMVKTVDRHAQNVLGLTGRAGKYHTKVENVVRILREGVLTDEVWNITSAVQLRDAVARSSDVSKRTSEAEKAAADARAAAYQIVTEVANNEAVINRLGTRIHDAEKEVLQLASLLKDVEGNVMLRVEEASRGIQKAGEELSAIRKRFPVLKAVPNESGIDNACADLLRDTQPTSGAQVVFSSMEYSELVTQLTRRLEDCESRISSVQALIEQHENEITTAESNAGNAATKVRAATIGASLAEERAEDAVKEALHAYKSARTAGRNVEDEVRIRSFKCTPLYTQLLKILINTQGLVNE
ncbi:hypothetical protein TRVL_09425 [Trypanosoma vivax]|nr:hypothetical protein TRVL_09425 [Trypanosoma vivax]